MALEPTAESARALAKHIQESMRAFPLVDLAKMVLGSRQRYQVRFRATGQGKKLYRGESDGSLWISRDEAVSHALQGDALERYYEIEEIDLGPPKGNFQSVAICGMSGEILGPPNHHEYQRNLARLHAERFSHMSIDRFRSRVEVHSDEETIEKWKELVSRRKQYRPRPEPAGEKTSEEGGTEMADAPPSAGDHDSSPEDAAGDTSSPSVEGEAPANREESDTGSSAESTKEEATPPSDPPENTGDADAPSDSDAPGTGEAEEAGEDPVPDTEPEAPAPEGPVLQSGEELKRHFREHFADKEVVELSVAVVAGDVPARHLSRGLLEHLKTESEKLRRGFPLPMIQALCNALEKEGLKFFKRGKKALHVSAVRPRALDPGEGLTDRIQSIVTFITENPRAPVVDMLAALSEDFEKPAPGNKEAEIPLTESARDLLKDLHWLKSLGYVLEFPDTRLQLGKPPGSAPAPSRKKKPESTKSRKDKKGSRKRRVSPVASRSPDPLPEDSCVVLDQADDDPHDPYSLPSSVDPVEVW